MARSKKMTEIRGAKLAAKKRTLGSSSPFLQVSGGGTFFPGCKVQLGSPERRIVSTNTCALTAGSSDSFLYDCMGKGDLRTAKTMFYHRRAPACAGASAGSAGWTT